MQWSTFEVDQKVSEIVLRQEFILVLGQTLMKGLIYFKCWLYIKYSYYNHQKNKQQQKDCLVATLFWFPLTSIVWIKNTVRSIGTETVWLSTFLKIYILSSTEESVEAEQAYMHNRFETTWQNE